MTTGENKKRGKGEEGETGRRGEPKSESDTQSVPIEWEDDEIGSGDLILPLSHSPALPLSHSPTLKVAAPTESEGQRLHLFLVSQFGGASRSAIQRAISGGDVTVNGKTVKPSHRVSAGEEIVGEIPDAPVIDAVPEDIPL